MKTINLFLCWAIVGIVACGRSQLPSEPVTPPKVEPEPTKTAKVLDEDQILFSDKTRFLFDKLNLIKLGLEFKTNAIGRETFFGSHDYPHLALTDDSYTHPTIVRLKEPLNGYSYWLALTPFFGKVAQQKDFTSFENPYIFRSKDGISWEEPQLIKNPIDTPAVGPNISFWSDPNLVYQNQKFYCFYRGNGFPKNYFGDKKNHYRSVVYRVSTDGVIWSEKTLVYSTLSQGVDDESGIVSPSVVFNPIEKKFYDYDVVFSSKKNTYSERKNQQLAFIMRRESDNINGKYANYGEDKICNLLNHPWPKDNDPWHLEVKRYNGMYFMLLNTGLAGKSNGDELYLGYSIDGVNFKFIEKPIFNNNTYKSTFLPVELTENTVSFHIYQSEKGTGRINLYKLDLNYLNDGI